MPGIQTYACLALVQEWEWAGISAHRSCCMLDDQQTQVSACTQGKDRALALLVLVLVREWE